MKPVYGLVLSLAVCAIPLGFAQPATARGAFEPTFHQKPCSGDSCQADDPRSGTDCQGLLCTFSSSKAMQPPYTASQAAEAERARAAAAQVVAAPPPAAAPSPTRTRKRVAKAKAATVRTPAPPTAAADAGAAAEPAAAR